MPDKITVGTIYESCKFHPVLCTVVYDDDSFGGISLIDGSYPNNCAVIGCGATPLTIEQAVEINRDFDGYVKRRMQEL
ncbi:hypothetical protein ACQP2E_04145 [Actinoplanes sp. CA-015351]|uniref:hypothetical protein n=1 Tax=Actinoplanes sp. CA-015351 TaxID=3239897 RepID=UPI003D954674